ncbi:hypothetical protein GGX14DRAFT_540086 [Mycena pura]|uniref:Uncharacterized protein n=1 Tax=Mycena pura TaxID=153505 RepID=A0AAD6YNL4_9AGAR|nr:hypothetical protein GGX14DRAFT_540086 [Mycena pura]
MPAPGSAPLRALLAALHVRRVACKANTCGGVRARRQVVAGRVRRELAAGRVRARPARRPPIPVIFGVIPQPLSVWHGLVRALMYLLAPVAYPALRTLNTLLGADAPCVHVQEGAARSRCANAELSILNGALELGARSVVQLMTPMRDVVTLADDTVLDDGLTQYMYVPLECHTFLCTSRAPRTSSWAAGEEGTVHTSVSRRSRSPRRSRASAASRHSTTCALFTPPPAVCRCAKRGAHISSSSAARRRGPAARSEWLRSKMSSRVACEASVCSGLRACEASACGGWWHACEAAGCGESRACEASTCGRALAAGCVQGEANRLRIFEMV